MKFMMFALLVTAIIISHQWIAHESDVNSIRGEMESKLQRDQIALDGLVQENQRLKGENNELLATKAQLANLTQNASALQEQNSVLQEQSSVLQNRLMHSHTDSEVDELKRQLRVAALAATSLPHPEPSLNHAATGFPSANTQSTYQNNPDAFSQTEVNESPSQRMNLNRIRQAIDNGATASDILSDPYLAQLAKNDPAIQELVDEAERRNGK